ncbi:unnamed protein product, partial [Thlaspi arvense]
MRSLQTNTLSMTQSSYTAQHPESCCEAVRLCCVILVEREILENARTVTWDMLIQQSPLLQTNLNNGVELLPEKTIFLKLLETSGFSHDLDHLETLIANETEADLVFQIVKPQGVRNGLVTGNAAAKEMICSNKRTRCLANTIDFMKLKSFKATMIKLSETEHPLINV